MLIVCAGASRPEPPEALPQSRTSELGEKWGFATEEANTCPFSLVSFGPGMALVVGFTLLGRGEFWYLYMDK